MAGNGVIILTKENFEQEVLNSEKPVLVDFWAQWCGPCRAVAPVMDEIAQEFEGSVKVGKINVDEQSELAAKYKIMSIPTVILFKNGQIAEKVTGVRSKQEFSDLVKKNL